MDLAFYWVDGCCGWNWISTQIKNNRTVKALKERKRQTLKGEGSMHDDKDS